uniref:N-acetyltransferase domain-containing protein n=1 Tax=Aureoumbra lagunensis TaxID=44058 RepID=A0A7S3NN50_9STRA
MLRSTMILKREEHASWPQNIIFQIATLLYEAWPEHRTIVQRQRDIANTNCCDRLLILSDEGKVIAHLRLEQSKISNCDGASAGIATSIVVNQDKRGQGLGRRLLSLAEKESEHRGWGYLYVEAIPSAIQFYQRCGYLESPNGAENDVPVLRLIDTTAIEILLQKSHNKEKITNKLWMRKRLLERSTRRVSIIPSQLESAAKMNGFSIIKTIESIIWEWEKQIGPSCGLAVLRILSCALNQIPCTTERICIEHDTLIFSASGSTTSTTHHESDSKNCPLLRRAKKLGLTNDGEFFDMGDLARLVNECLGLDVMLLESNRWKSLVQDCIDKGYLCIFAYDRDRNTHLPVFRSGLSAHYALCLGYARAANNNDTKVAAIAIHGVSPHPLIADIDDFYASSDQLRTAKYQTSTKEMLLARRLLILGKRR